MDAIWAMLDQLFAALTAAPQILTIVGLSLDALGVIFLVLFGAPKFERLSGPGFLGLEGKASLAEEHPWLRWIGLPAIVIGFGLQIVANVIEIS